MELLFPDLIVLGWSAESIQIFKVYIIIMVIHMIW